MHAEAEPIKHLPTQAMMMGLRFGKVPTVDRHIEDEEVLEVGGLRLRSLYTPGHAPGHLAFYLEDEGLVLSGHALFAGSVGRTDLFGGDMDLLMRSINEKLLTLPDEKGCAPDTAPRPLSARSGPTTPSWAEDWCERERTQAPGVAPEHVRLAVITISDTRTPENDTGGDTIEELMRGAGHEIVERRIVRDDAARIRTEIVNLLARPDADAVITTGGTGISARDTTYEVVSRMIEKKLDGFGEIFARPPTRRSGPPQSSAERSRAR